LLALSARLKPCPCYKAPSQRSLQTRALLTNPSQRSLARALVAELLACVPSPRVFLQVFENKRQQEPVGCKCLILKRKIASVSFQGSCYRQKGLKSMPQGLKPRHFVGLIGPAKAVPLLQSPITAQPANSCPCCRAPGVCILLPLSFCKCLKIKDRNC
jgi:hypothetical protein